jgi:polysaccharide pyruvyl transferase WcaK-like protein
MPDEGSDGSHDHAVRLSLFGAPGSNTNLGVGALMHGVMAAARAVRPDVEFTVFDQGRGVRPSSVTDTDGRVHGFRYVGAHYSRRLYRPENYLTMAATIPIGGRGNPGMRAVLASDAVLDISGGDSFSDIYGVHRFRMITAPKMLALRARRPLVLLPQTYGPFQSRATAGAARRIVAAAAQAWARDADSYEALRELAGDGFDPQRHRQGVDVAFLLPARRPTAMSEDLTAALATVPRPVGVNVSGLLWSSGNSFGLRADYRRTMLALVRDLVRRGHRVLIVPHVLGQRPGGEADNVAARELVDRLAPEVAARVSMVDSFEDASTAKGVIAQCSFFVGTRMHSTIAALSSAVPAVGLAYSHKYRGVFASVGRADAVLDLRAMDSGEVAQAVKDAQGHSQEWREDLARRVPTIQQRARDQMRTILGVVDAPQQ